MLYKHHREGLEESYALISFSELEGSYGTIVQEACIEENVSCFKKCLKKIIWCEKIEAPPPQPPPDLGQKTHDSEQESDAVIPVDDVSPITITPLMRYCTEKSSVICSNYSKLLFLYYILLFIIYYYKLLFSLLYNDRDIKRAINIPGARLEGKLSEWFDMTNVYFDLRVEIIILVVVFLIGLPLIPIFYIEPCDLIINHLCSGCKKNPFYLRTDIREHLRTAPRQIFWVAKCLLLCIREFPKVFACSACVASRPSVRWCRGKLALSCMSSCRLLKVFFMCVCGLVCSILLIVSLILFWGVILAVSITIYLIL